MRSRQDPAATLAVMDLMGLTQRPQRHLVVTPWYHSAPFVFTLFMLNGHGSVVFLRTFNSKVVLRTIERYRCTSVFLPPVFLKRLLKELDSMRASNDQQCDTSSLKNVIVGAAPFPPSLKREAVEKLGPIVYEFYGSSELGFNAVMSPSWLLIKPESCGRLVNCQQACIVDPDASIRAPLAFGSEGVFCVAWHPNMFDGYLGRSSETSAAFGPTGDWVTVFDMARIDSEGFLYILDRRTDIINRGGVKIYSSEIENCLQSNPDVADCAVFGMPDAEFGQRVHVAIQCQVTDVLGRRILEQKLLCWCQERLSNFKIPREFSFHSTLPRTVTGKINKEIVRRTVLRQSLQSKL